MPDEKEKSDGGGAQRASVEDPAGGPSDAQVQRSQSPDPPKHRLGRQLSNVDAVLETLAATGGLMQDDHDRVNATEAKLVPESDFATRLSFTLGVLNACIVSFAFHLSLRPCHSGRPPEQTSFVIGRPFGVFWYLVKAIVLLSYRWLTFKVRVSQPQAVAKCSALGKSALAPAQRMGHHYYMIDFCYICNLMLCGYIIVAALGYGAEPWAIAFFKALFAMTQGPLLWAIPLFRNKLKFHSLQHVISVFIHISPATVTYAIRWCLDPAVYGVSQAPAGSFSTLLWELEGGALPYYLLWLAGYYAIVFCVRSKRISERQYETLFSFIMDPANHHPARQVLNAITTHPALQKVVYLGLHLGLGLVTMAFTPLLWQYLELHTLFVTAILGSACWNASKGYLRMQRAAKLQ